MARPKKKIVPKHASGMYEYKATVGKSFDGKAIRKSFYSSVSIEDAKNKAEEYKIEKAVAERTGDILPSTEITFAVWSKKWLETYKKPTVTTNTYLNTYENTVVNHLLPYFGSARLLDIKNIDVQKFFSLKQDCSESLLHKMKLCLSGIFEAAIENDLCLKNPAKNINYVSKKEKNEKKVLTDEQIQIAKDYFYDDMPELYTILETGLRRGELLGLMWKDIDFESKTLRIERSVCDKKGGGVELNPPKWDSYRTIPISQKLVDKFNLLPRDSIYIFPNVNGELNSPHTWARKLDRHVKALQKSYPAMPALTAHEFRHTRGTQLRRNGVDIYTIQKLLGHKDINVTANIYVHDEVEVTRTAAKIV